MIGGWGYQIAPPPFAVSRPADSARARAPPWPRGRNLSGSEDATGPAVGPPALANQESKPEVNYGQESRYVLPYISPRSAQEASRVQLQPDQLRYGERK